jgi:carboxyl-terminal processing protease
MSKKIKNVVIAVVSLVLLALSFGAGCALGSSTQVGQAQGLGVVEQAWNIIFQDYVDKDRLDAGALSHAAIDGMVGVLDDPYAAYVDAEDYKLSSGSLAGKIEGIGAQVALRDAQIMIIAPIPDSPAARAGIRAGDVILEVDGWSTEGMSLAEAVLNIRGPKGTSVRLLILHQGETTPEEVEIVRAEIEVPSVSYEMRGDISYVSIHYFSERTNEELSAVLEGLDQNTAQGIVLDLRSNPGGLLSEVVDVASRFLREGTVVSVVDNEGKHTPSLVEPDGVVTDLPIVVLVDAYSASGSEVLAGALQDHGRAVVAGTKTFGKGSVNILRELKDGSGLFITTARWLTPNGHLIEGEGLYPDIELELVGEDAIQWAMDYLRGNK